MSAEHIGCPFRRCRSRRKRWRRLGFGSICSRSRRLFGRFRRGIGRFSSFGRRIRGEPPGEHLSPNCGAYR